MIQPGTFYALYNRLTDRLEASQYNSLQDARKARERFNLGMHDLGYDNVATVVEVRTTYQPIE